MTACPHKPSAIGAPVIVPLAVVAVRLLGGCALDIDHMYTAGPGEQHDLQLLGSGIRPSRLPLQPAQGEGPLVYRARPLYEVIEDVQRYTTQHIVLDAVARDLLYTGTFSEHDVEQWLAALSKIFPVAIEHSRPNLIFIRSRPIPQLKAQAQRADRQLECPDCDTRSSIYIRSSDVCLHT